VVQHIALGFDAGLAEWLARELEIDVATAEEGAALRPGTVRIAPPGAHLRLDTSGELHLDRFTPPVRGHRPSANILFESMLDHDPHRVAAVLLSGMGRDGAEGMLALHRAGAFTVAQDEASCAVFGMPRAALDLGATDLALSPCEIGRLLAESMRGNQV
jgi:two-component system chemotaxis response regulator CheB